MMMELGIEPRALYLPFWVGGKNSSKGILRRLPPMEKPTHSKRETKDNGRYNMPTMTDWMARHQAVTKELAELFAAKNEDYGDSFHRTFLEEGMAAARVRLTDKLNRFKALTKGKAANVKDESVRDTLLDLANYAIMTVMELDESEAQHEPDKAATVLSELERAIAAKLNAKYVTRSDIDGGDVEFWRRKPLVQGGYYCASGPDNRRLMAISTDIMLTRLKLGDCVCVSGEVERDGTAH